MAYPQIVFCITFVWTSCPASKHCPGFVRSVAFFFHAAKKLPTTFPLYVHFKQLSFKAGINSLIFLLQEGLEGFEEVTNPKGIVLNPETNEDVDMGEWRTSHFGHLTIFAIVDCAFLSTSL